ncbi:hypothetical protein GE09DRAFT_557961 [Coniochaeta sp. 2T2.1]|nr:hypothetical protein GE09DRAFT_557961 [Coniochaeta sp. 2T2.1]
MHSLTKLLLFTCLYAGDGVFESWRHATTLRLISVPQTSVAYGGYLIKWLTKKAAFPPADHIQQLLGALTAKFW